MVQGTFQQSGKQQSSKSRYRLDSSSLYDHRVKQIRLEVHGDGFAGVGAKTMACGFSEEHWTIELRGVLGPPSMLKVDHSIAVLNRLLT